MKKSNEAKAIELLMKEGFTRVVIVGVKNDVPQMVHNGVAPIEIVGLMEVVKMITVKIHYEQVPK